MCCNNLSTKCENLTVMNSNRKIEFMKGEYCLTENKSGYEIIILSEEKLKLISEMEKPEIHFCVKEENQIAYGNSLFASTIAKGAEYFFGLSNKNYISFSHGNKILLSMTSKVIAN